MNILNIKIKTKLIYIVFVPLIALIGLVSILVIDNYNKSIAMDKLNSAVELSVSITSLVHETQKERGATAGFIGSAGKKFADKLPSQRKLTDVKISELKNRLQTFKLNDYSSKYQAQVNQALSSLDKISNIRTQVSALSIPAKDAIGYYTKMNGEFLATITILSSISGDASIANEISAYSNFLQAKERAGIERAVGSATFANDKFGTGAREKFTSLITAQDTYLNTFKQLSSKDGLDALSNTLKGKDVDEVNRMRDIALRSSEIGGFGIDPNVWFSQITLKINKLKKVDDYISKNLPKHQLNTLNKKIAALLHETQKERGMTAGYLGSKGKKFANELPKQRKLTNKRLAELKKAIKTIKLSKYKIVKSQLNDAFAMMKKIGAIRAEVSKLNIGAKKAIGYYTSMNTEFLHTVSKSAFALKSTDATSYANFLLSKERAGIERAVATNTFARNKFITGMKEKWITLITEQNSYMNTFIMSAKPNIVNYYNKTIQGSDIITVNSMRKIALDSSTIGGFNIDATYWFETITAKINLLKKVDDNLATSLINDTHKIQSDAQSDMSLYAIIGLLLVIFTSVLGFLTSRSISNGLTNLNEAILTLLSSKDTSNRIKITTKDEISEISNNFNDYLQSIEDGILEDAKLIQSANKTMTRVKNGWYSEVISATTSNTTLEEFKNNVNEMIRATKDHFVDVNTILEQYAKYDFRNELVLDNIEKGGVFELLVNDINFLREAITDMLVENKKNGLILDHDSDILLQNVESLNTSSTEQAASLEETAASVEEITANIQSTADKANSLLDISETTRDKSTIGKKLADDTSVAMDEINESTTAIANAITVIDQIAFQTNILSLNAAVEAATAGEAGKGFAVVAGEVRNLAARSAEAANEIKALVEQAKTKSDEGKDIASKMTEGYTELDANIEETVTLVTDTVKATNEQMEGMKQINNAVSQLDTALQENASVAQQTNGVAIQADEISKRIVSNADAKEFIGKDNIDISSYIKSSGASKSVKSLTNINKQTINTSENLNIQNQNDEWDSF